MIIIDKDLAEFCVNFALKNGASYSEARFVSTSEEGYILKNGIPESSVFTVSKGLGIRVLSNGGLSFLAINKFDKENIKSKIKEAIKIAKVSSKSLKEPIELSKEKTFKDSWQVKPKIKLENVDPKEKMDYLFDVEKELKDIHSKLPSRLFQLTTDVEEKYFVNSEGTKIYSKVPRVGMFYSVIASANGNTEQRYFPTGESGGWEILKRWDFINKISREARALIKILNEAKSLPKENLDVVLSPELVGIAMHESSGHPAEADRIMGREGAQAGESYLTKEWLGKRIGSDVVTVVDDPTTKNSWGFYEYDDEGVKAQRRFLIKDGIINDFLHNRETAVKFNKQSNASARASAFDREPVIRMSTTFMLPGDFTFEELLEDIKKGVFIKTYTEWNIDDKRWNERYVGCEAYLIENGELKGLVRRPVLEITTQGFFSSVDACGKKEYLDFIGGTCGKCDPMQAVPVWMGGPFVRLRNIPVSSG
jgi:TldD protein